MGGARRVQPLGGGAVYVHLPADRLQRRVVVIRAILHPRQVVTAVHVAGGAGAERHAAVVHHDLRHRAKEEFADRLERETRGAERTTLSDAEIVDVMQKMVKQRQEALALYEKAGRDELAAQEREEIGIISAYLLKQLSDIEAGEVISGLIRELEAATLKDMGRTMAALKQRFAGQMDFGKAGAQVKKLLGG